MQTRLRWLSRWVLMLGLALVFTTGAQAGPLSTPVFSAASGDVDQTSVVLWAHSPKAGTLTFAYAADSQFSSLLGTQTAAQPDPTVPARVEITNLSAGTRYFYRVTDSAGSTVTGTFRTAAAKGQHTGLKFGVTGDWQQALAPYPSIKNAIDAALDFFVLHGDTIYADVPSPDVPAAQARTLADYRKKHNEALAARYGLDTWAQLRQSTALFATIDDHEVTNDFAGGAPPKSNPRFDRTGAYINETTLYKNGLQAFFEYMPIRAEVYGATGDPRTANKPKLYRYRTFGSDAAIFLLDERSFRDQELPSLPFNQVTQPDRVKAYLADAAKAGRTMLGQAQLADLKRDLLQAQQDGITWKFILNPEPIQSFGVLNAQDRYEGYAAERTDLLDFITTQQIRNVVFITADFHGTIVNNIIYSKTPDSPQIKTDAWEIITGPVAVDPPFGPQVIELIADAKVITPAQKSLYDLAPMSLKDNLVKQLLDKQIEFFGYDPVGLDKSPIDAKLIRGGYVATHVYGWTEFEIDAKTGQLLVTTYGIPWYTQAQLDANPQAIIAQTPTIVSQFSVNPK